MDFQTVQQVLQHHKSDLIALGVQRLELFGSAARGNTGHDLDFLVSFQPMPVLEHGRAYFALLERLQLALDLPIDLLEEVAIDNPFFLESIAKDRKLVYAA